MSLQRTRLRSSELLLASRVRPNRRDDEPFAVGRNVELGIGRDPEKLQDRLVNDNTGAVSDGLQTLRRVPLRSARATAKPARQGCQLQRLVGLSATRSDSTLRARLQEHFDDAGPGLRHL